MRASKVSRETLIQAADEVGVRIECDAIGRQFRVKLYPDTPQSLYRPPCKGCRDRVESSVTINPFLSKTERAAEIARWTKCRCRRWPDERGDAKYQRQSASMYGNERRVHAVCWHGFRDFFRAVYRREPMARFTTVMATWQNSDHFEANFRETGHKNIGSQMYPVAAASACRCPESDRVGVLTHQEEQRRIAIHCARAENDAWQSGESLPLDTYGADEADGAMCRAMANALRGN